MTREPSFAGQNRGEDHLPENEHPASVSGEELRPREQAGGAIDALETSRSDLSEAGEERRRGPHPRANEGDEEQRPQFTCSDDTE